MNNNRTRARRVRSVQGAPSLETAHGLFRFVMEDGSEESLAVPHNVLPGVAGLALGFCRAQDGELTALEVDGVHVAGFGTGRKVIIMSLAGQMGSIPLGLTDEQAAALKRQL